MTIGDIVHYVAKAAPDRCCAAIVREVNTDGSLDLMVIDAGPEEEFRKLVGDRLGGPVGIDRKGRPANDGHGGIIYDFPATGKAVTFPGGCFVFKKECDGRNCSEARMGKWHWPCNPTRTHRHRSGQKRGQAAR